MKTKILSFLIVVLLAGCYGYKKVPLGFEGFEEGDRVKIVLKDKTLKGKFLLSTNDTLVLDRGRDKKDYIPIADILKIKKGKFSITKSILMPTGIAFGSGIAIFFMGGWDIDAID
ncbi:MAG: hypothetical protein ED555_01435 [Allomuricauda sp.]|nr:MAG: hypothetical protein ED555_01435 [Allomuricauda sp.]